MVSGNTPESPSSPCSSVCSEVRAEEIWRRTGEDLAMSKVSEKVVEEKEQQLREYIRDNYSRLQGVEKELANMQLELKLVGGPKRSALEMLRKKIEQQNEHVVKARSRHRAVKELMATTEKELHQAEAVKDRLCSELNLLVQQSSRIQLEKLEQLTERLENLHRGEGPSNRGPASHPQAPNSTFSVRSASAEPGPSVPSRLNGGPAREDENWHSMQESHSSPWPTPLHVRIEKDSVMRKSSSEGIFKIP